MLVTTSRRTLVVAMLSGVSALAASLSMAQCPDAAWLPGAGVPGIQGFADYQGGVVGEVSASVMWDPDGNGPATARLVVGGTFSYAGSVRVSNIAMWDGVEWSSLGTGMEGGPVLSLAVLGNGQLVAGGVFAVAGGTAVNNIAVWNGTEWSGLGTGVDSNVSDIVVRANGHIIVAGAFEMVTNTGTARGVARWDGTDWFPIGQGLRALTTGTDPGQANGLALAPNGDIYVVGTFERAGTTLATNIAKLVFNGAGTTGTWTALGGGLSGTGPNGEVPIGDDAVVLSNGNVVAFGSFTTAGTTPCNNIARWNGTTWSAMGDGLGADMNNPVLCGLALANGEMVAGGYFENSGATTTFGVARWNGSTWSPMPEFDAFHYSFYDASVYSLTTMANGDLAVGGVMQGGVVRSNGTTASNLGSGFNTGMSVATMANGNIIAAGGFDAAPGGVVAQRVAMFDGTSWSPMGGGIDVSGSSILPLPNGDVLVAGTLVPSNGDPAINQIVRWNGTAWSVMSTDINAFGLARLPNGDIVAAGSLGADGGVYRWTGTAWEVLGAPFLLDGQPGYPLALAVMPNGDLIAGGYFDTAGGTPFTYIGARWDGTAWSAMGFGVGNPLEFEGVNALAVRPNGDVVIAGQFASNFDNIAFGNVARWNGSSWTAMGDGLQGGVFTMASLANGDIVASGYMPESVVRWDGTAWSGVGPVIEGTVYSIAPLPNGNFAVGGGFAFVGGQSSANFAVFGCQAPPTCPADLAGTGGPGADGGVDINDLLYYLQQFEGGSIAADLDDGSGLGHPDGGVDISDLIYFLIHFEQGC